MDMDYTVGEVELTYKSTSKSRNKIYSSEDAYEVLLSTYREGTICYKEYFKVLFLNQAKQVLGYTLISEGGITETCADVRVILQAALLTNSVAIILAHNHPSGNLKPSRQDMEITKQVKDAAQLMRITVIDHLILTDAGYYKFMPFDGQFRDNVIVQVKNGPIDFQPREPFSPLFGAMQHTQVMPEFQITQEYLGQSIHTVFLATMWKDCLDAETYRVGGGTVADVTQHRVGIHSRSAVAGVANIGDVVNWTGNDMAQANWYAFGRLCWNTELSAEQIAEEFLKQTFSTDEHFIEPVRQLLLRSWDTAVSYMMPLGLHHIFAFGHHYGPEPWCAPPDTRPDWLPKYYHRADTVGVGFDRTVRGTKAVLQYHEPLATLYGDKQAELLKKIM